MYALLYNNTQLLCKCDAAPPNEQGLIVRSPDLSRLLDEPFLMPVRLNGCLSRD
jgi:hypothetical protein